MCPQACLSWPLARANALCGTIPEEIRTRSRVPCVTRVSRPETCAAMPSHGCRRWKGCARGDLAGLVACILRAVACHVQGRAGDGTTVMPQRQATGVGDA